MVAGPGGARGGGAREGAGGSMDGSSQSSLRWLFQAPAEVIALRPVFFY
jgi:hypothetical protein